MAVSTASRVRRTFGIRAVRIGIGILACTMLSFGGASAESGGSFVQLPGIVGGSSGQDYKKWLRVEAYYWKSSDEGGILGGGRRRGVNLRRKMFFSYPVAPRSGGDSLVIAVDKRNPMLRRLMDNCAKKTKLSELTFAESADGARGVAEGGPRPADVPAYFEYRLKDVQFSACPVVEGAPEQAIVLSFNAIQWLNGQGVRDGQEIEGQEIKPIPAVLTPLRTSGSTKSFVVSWFANANDVADDQCPKVNAKPTEDDYYALVSKEDAARERIALAKQGGVNNQNGQMSRRGPDKLNVCLLPGVVRDSGFVYPQTRIARGFDLDGNNGTGAPPANVCRHQNYGSQDGRTGIDNQLYTVMGCVPGYQGHKGFLLQYRNEQRRNGSLAVLVQISGIDDEKNDDNVAVTILYSKDPMAKNASGTRILADYTFRLTNDPEYTRYVTRLRGRIVNGVVVTEPVKYLEMHLATDPPLNLFDARMRLEILPDGSLKGIVGGYEDWRRVMKMSGNSTAEGLYGFQCPAFYQALKRAADGLKDPVTGECNGISSAYDIEGSPALIPPAQLKTLVAQADTK